jgi:hypothetical protein
MGGGAVPERGEAPLTAKRLKKWEGECFRFIDEGIEAANNPAKLTMRQSVVGRMITQGRSVG